MSTDPNTPCPYKVLATLSGPKGSVCVRYTKEGDYGMLCGGDRSVKLFNPQKGSLIKTYEGHGKNVNHVIASDDNSKLGTASDDKLSLIWDVISGKYIRKLRGHTSKVNCIQFNDVCNVAYTGSYDTTVRVWDLRAHTHTPIQVLGEATDSVSCLTTDGFQVIAASIDGYVRNYDIRAGKLTSDCVGHPITSVSLSSDRKCMLTSTLDGKIRLFDRSNGRLLNEFSGHPNTSYKVESAFTYDNKYVASGSEDGTLYIWDIITGTIVFKLKEHGRNTILASLTCHPTLPRLMTASTGGEVLIWNGLNQH